MALRDDIWPDLNTKWQCRRSPASAHVRVPRCLPLIGAIIDTLAPAQPASGVYWELWCRSDDRQVVTLAAPHDIAHLSTLSGLHAADAWQDRLVVLRELGFIDIRPGPHGPMGYALLLNPYLAIKKLHDLSTPGLSDAHYAALQARCIEIGEASIRATVPGPLLKPRRPLPERDQDHGQPETCV